MDHDGRKELLKKEKNELLIREKFYKKSPQIEEDNVNTYNNLGVDLGKLGRYDEAIQCYKKAIRLNPKYATAYYNLGEVFGKLKKYAEAIHAYQTFIRLADQKDNDLIEKARKEVEELVKEWNAKSESSD